MKIRCTHLGNRIAQERGDSAIPRSINVEGKENYLAYWWWWWFHLSGTRTNAVFKPATYGRFARGWKYSKTYSPEVKYFLSRFHLSRFFSMRIRAADRTRALDSSHVFESYARPFVHFSRAHPLGSFHVAGNFTVIYDSGMDPRPRASREKNTSPRRGSVASSRFHLIRYD